MVTPLLWPAPRPWKAALIGTTAIVAGSAAFGLMVARYNPREVAELPGAVAEEIHDPAIS